MFFISKPETFTVGDTADCRINGKPERVTWKDKGTLIIEPGDARRIVEVRQTVGTLDGREAVLNCFLCADSEGREPVSIVPEVDGIFFLGRRGEKAAVATARRDADGKRAVLLFSDTDCARVYLARNRQLADFEVLMKSSEDLAGWLRRLRGLGIEQAALNPGTPGAGWGDIEELAAEFDMPAAAR
jgi:hypothetical protein